ncbi:MAG: response regulator [Candidatus Ornithospirochaeta sp.]
MIEIFNDGFKMYTALTFLTIATLLIEIICIKATSLDVANSFVKVFYLVVVAAFCEWFGVAAPLFLPLEFRGLLILIKSVELMVAPVIPVAMALSISREKPKLYHIIPLTISVIVIFSSVFTENIFYFTNDNIYHHGPFYFVYIIAYFAGVLYMVVKVILVSKKKGFHDILVLFLSFSLLLAGMIIQALYSNIRIDWCAAAMASTLVCLNYLTQDQKKAVEDMKKAMDEANMANKAKTNFMGRMSHDLRTPINGIMGMAQIAKKNLGNEEVVSDCLDKIDSSNRHLMSLIGDILQMSSLESGGITLSHESFDIVETLSDSIEMLSSAAKDRGVRIIDDDYENIKYRKVIGSPSHVRQVFTNIISNAVKYNKMGGFVEVKTSVIGDSEGKVTYRFTFSDTGLGMSDDFLKKIFEPFSREDDENIMKRPGSGLGMSIVKDLVTLMGGSITVISEKNVGSVFTVDIPFDVDAESEAKESKDNAPDSFEGKRVLLVEDNDLNQEIALYMLKEKGFDVDTADNGKEAVGKFLSSKPFYYNLILMDIMMPVMNGLEATRAIRSSGRSDYSVPIIAMTANAYEEDKKECIEAGMNEHIAKPLEESEIMAAIKRNI